MRSLSRVDMMSLLQGLSDMPWRVCNELRRRLVVPYVRFAFAVCGVRWGHGWRIFGTPVIQRHRGSQIELGDYLELRCWQTTNPLTPNRPVMLATRTAEAVIRIGHHCGFTGGGVVAAERIEIGDWVSVGANSIITDTDFHPLDPYERRNNNHNANHRPVTIGDDVFIGMNCLILKGVTIGRGTVIGAGSVVTRDMPPGVVAAGNPAHVIRPLKPHDV